MSRFFLFVVCEALHQSGGFIIMDEKLCIMCTMHMSVALT